MQFYSPTATIWFFSNFLYKQKLFTHPRWNESIFNIYTGERITIIYRCWKTRQWGHQTVQFFRRWWSSVFVHATTREQHNIIVQSTGSFQTEATSHEIPAAALDQLTDDTVPYLQRLLRIFLNRSTFHRQNIDDTFSLNYLLLLPTKHYILTVNAHNSLVIFYVQQLKPTRSMNYYQVYDTASSLTHTCLLHWNSLQFNDCWHQLLATYSSHWKIHYSSLATSH